MIHPLMREIEKIAIGVGILGIVMAIVICMAWGINAPLLWGTLLGCIYAVFNFALTAYSVSQSVQKSENAAKAYMAGGYYLRLALTAAVIYWAIRAPYFNVFGAAIPLVFPRIVITVCSLARQFNPRKDGGEQGK